MSSEDLAFTPAWQLLEWIKERKVSPVEIVETYLSRIERLNPSLNAFLTLCADEALDGARRAEAEVMAGADLGPLHGLPLPIKDLTPTAGIRTTHGSLILRDYIPQRDAIHVERVRRAGAIIIGKTNTPEFGHRGTTENLLGDPCRNPWDPTRTPGGSSGGAAVSVAAGLSPVAEGSDGGGSIRIPASFCGVYGIKPTHGRVPRSYRGRGPWNPLPQNGPLSRSVRDAALLLQVMAGPHADDPLSIPDAPPDFQDGLERGVEGLRIAWSPDWGTAAVDPEVRALAESAAREFEDLGADVEELDYVLDEEAARATFVSLFLSDMDAAYGHFLDQSPDLLMPSLRAWLEEARRWRAADLSRALREMEWHRAGLRDLFQRFDLLLTPTTAVPAFPVEGWPDTIGGRPVDPLWGFNPFCYLFNMTGHPAASVPCGFVGPFGTLPSGSGAMGLPVGLQIAGRLGDEASVLRASAALETARPWAQHRPPIA